MCLMSEIPLSIHCSHTWSKSGVCLGPYGDPSRGAVSSGRGTPVTHLVKVQEGRFILLHAEAGQHTIHHTLYTPHPTPHTFHPTPCNMHPAACVTKVPLSRCVTGVPGVLQGYLVKVREGRLVLLHAEVGERSVVVVDRRVARCQSQPIKFTIQSVKQVRHPPAHHSSMRGPGPGRAHLG